MKKEDLKIFKTKVVKKKKKENQQNRVKIKIIKNSR